jgi:ribonuclease VapC
MFVDASALCAILLDEPEREVFEHKLALARDTITSPVAVWETFRAMIREIGVDPDRAQRRLMGYLDATEIRLVEIGTEETHRALEAMVNFGKGRHSAALNMGDCFAYACAKAHSRSLLFKGDDFSQTDIQSA